MWKRSGIDTNTTPDPGYLWESDNFTIRHHKREPRGQQPFSAGLIFFLGKNDKIDTLQYTTHELSEILLARQKKQLANGRKVKQGAISMLQKITSHSQHKYKITKP